MAIKKGDLTRYLKSLLPLFGEGWFLHAGIEVLRMDGLLLQGVTLNRSSYSNEFVPTYFTMILAEPSDDYFIHFTLGNRLEDYRGGDCWLPLPLDKGNSDEELRVRWRNVQFTPDGLPDQRWLYETIRSQATPRIDEPLTMEAVRDYLKQEKSDHFAVLWSRGIAEGLLGNIDGARKWLTKCEKVLSKNAENWEKKGAAPESLVNDLRGVQKMITYATDAEVFRRYCEDVAIRNKEKLKL